MKTSLEMVLPRATGSSMSVSWNFLELRMLYIETTLGVVLGTSMPIVPLPGMGAMIRMPMAARLRAMSFSRFLILAMRTPLAGVIS